MGFIYEWKIGINRSDEEKVSCIEIEDYEEAVTIKRLHYDDGERWNSQNLMANTNVNMQTTHPDTE